MSCEPCLRSSQTGAEPTLADGFRHCPRTGRQPSTASLWCGSGTVKCKARVGEELADNPLSTWFSEDFCTQQKYVWNPPYCIFEFTISVCDSVSLSLLVLSGGCRSLHTQHVQVRDFFFFPGWGGFLCDSVCDSSLAFAWAIPKSQMSPLPSLPLLFTVIYFECLFLLLFSITIALHLCRLMCTLWWYETCII